MNDNEPSKLRVISQNTTLSIGIAVMLIGFGFWLGKLANTTSTQAEILERHERILTTLSEVAIDNKRRIDWIDERDTFRKDK